MEETVCKLCFKTFDENIRPRCLSCGHSFCTSCINKLIENEKLSCPLCKQTHHAVSGNDFPINYAWEENISNTQRAQSCVASQGQIRSMDSKLQELIEDKSSAENLILVSDELLWQITEYHEFIWTKYVKHEVILKKVNDLVKRNEVIMKEMDDERKRVSEIYMEFDSLMKHVKDQLPSLNDATSTKSALGAIVGLEHFFFVLEDWNKYCQKKLPNTKIVSSSKKVLAETMAAMSMVEAVCDEVSPKFDDLSNTGLTILERTNKIWNIDTITVERLQTLSKNLVEIGLAYATQSKEGIVRCAKVSQKGDEMYLHCLQDGEPPVYAHTIKQSELLNILNFDSTEVFLDLSWEGSIKGRVVILLSPDTPLARHFRMLCTGDLGPSYAHSKFIKVDNKGDTINEDVSAGDYEYNDGSGGAFIVEGLERNDALYKRPFVEGSVWARFSISDDNLCIAQFVIVTGKGNPSKTVNCVFGQVQKGLDVLREATKLNDIRDVEIIDCGVVIPL